MEMEWQNFLKTIGEHIRRQVYVPIEKYNIEKIVHDKSESVKTVTTEILECVKETELSIRAWMEHRRRQLFFRNGLNVEDGYIEYIRAAFLESLDAIMRDFQEQWTIELDNCLHKSISDLKKHVTIMKRITKAPMDSSQKHTHLTKIMNIRGDPELLTQAQEIIYNETIDELLQELKSGVPFSKIELQIAPVTDIKPYMDQMWNETVKFYKSLKVTDLFSQTLSNLYKTTREIWSALPTIYEYVEILDRSYRMKYWTNLFATGVSRHKFMFQGPFIKDVVNKYAAHRIVLENYIKKGFPKTIQGWAQQDLEKIVGDEHIQFICKQFQELYNVYVSKFKNDLENPDNLSWLSRALLILQKQDVAL